MAFATRWQTFWFDAYVFFLSLVVFHFAADAHIQKNLPVFLKNFPAVTFEKGFLTAPPAPVQALIPQSGFVIAFDAARQSPPTAAEMTDNKQLMLVNKNQVYMLSSSGVQSQTLPADLSFSTTPETLAARQNDIAAALNVVSFITALILVPMIMLFDFCIAACAGMFFKLITRAAVPNAVIFKWAVFLLGPLSALWYVRLWFYIPLFTLAQVILCIIYMQQIFNTIPEEH